MKKKILIVDDDIMTLKILKKYLDDSFEVVTENAGYRFVEKMESYGADLILLDMEMPVVNGLQAFEKLLENPRMKDTPVAFLSGVSNPELVRNVMLKGAAGYIVKTIPKRELIEKVNKILEKVSKEEKSAEIMILHGDIEEIKSMRATLMEAGYKVKLVKNVMDAVGYMKSHRVGAFIIGRDNSAAAPSEVYETVSETLKQQRVAGIIMENKFFSQELLDVVKDALGEEE